MLKFFKSIINRVLSLFRKKEPDPLQALFAGLEIAEVEIVVRPSNAYDAWLLWGRRAEVLQSFAQDKPEFQRADLTLLFAGQVISSTKQLKTNG